MRDFLCIVGICLFITTCSGDNNDSEIDMGLCPQYLACAEAANMLTAVLEATFGENGECWDDESAEMCQAQCEDALNAIIPTNAELVCFADLPPCEPFGGSSHEATLHWSTTDPGDRWVRWVAHFEEPNGTYTILELIMYTSGGIESGSITSSAFDSTLWMGCEVSTDTDNCSKRLIPIDGDVTIKSVDYTPADGNNSPATVIGSIDDAYYLRYSNYLFVPDGDFECISTQLHSESDIENCPDCPLNSQFPCACDTAETGAACDDGSWCASIEDDVTIGACFRPCEKDIDCEISSWSTCGGSPLCVLHDPATEWRYCGFVCSKDDDCPPDMKCAETSAGNWICVGV